MEKSIDLNEFRIRIHEPLAATLKGSPEEIDFELSLLDVSRLSGHLCLAVTGAFLVTQAAIEKLFPDGVCVRGDVEVRLPRQTTPAATGPVANVISYITGAWSSTGFEGLSGRHVRKDLLSFACDDVPEHAFVFKRRSTGATVLARFLPPSAEPAAGPDVPFADRLQAKVRSALAHPAACVEIAPWPARETKSVRI